MDELHAWLHDLRHLDEREAERPRMHDGINPFASSWCYSKVWDRAGCADICCANDACEGHRPERFTWIMHATLGSRSLKLNKLTRSRLENPILSKRLILIRCAEPRMGIASASRGEAIHAEVSCAQLPSSAKRRSAGKPLPSERCH